MPATLDQKISFRDATAAAFERVRLNIGIQPRISLIQSSLESNWGVSQLATDGFNIFSVTPGDLWIEAMLKNIAMDKVPAWSVEGHATIHLPTKEYSKFPPEKIRYWEVPGDIVKKEPDGKGGSVCVVNRYFRKYVSWDECAMDWANKIATQSRYHLAFDAAKDGNLSLYAHAVFAAGYADDPDYVGELVNAGVAVDALPPRAVPPETVA